jgi:hypothetical protein
MDYISMSYSTSFLSNFVRQLFCACNLDERSHRAHRAARDDGGIQVQAGHV